MLLLNPNRVCYNVYKGIKQITRPSPSNLLRLATSWPPPSILNAGHNSDPKGYSADGAPIVPCGQVAWSLLNDTYKILVDKKGIEVNKKDIAWQSDKNKKS